jgi:uncharacterized membrane protein
MSTVAAVFLHVLIVIMLINKSNWSQLFYNFMNHYLTRKLGHDFPDKLFILIFIAVWS